MNRKEKRKQSDALLELIALKANVLDAQATAIMSERKRVEARLNETQALCLSSISVDVQSDGRTEPSAFLFAERAIRASYTAQPALLRDAESLKARHRHILEESLGLTIARKTVQQKIEGR